MTKTRLLLGWPGPLWLFPVFGAGMAIMIFFATRDMLTAAYPTWNSVSTQWHESLWVPGAIASGAAAMVGFLGFPANSPVANALRLNAGSALFMRHGLSLGLWVILGQFVGLTPAILWAWRDATGGGFRPQEALMGIAGITMLAVTGFCAGTMVRHWVVGPLVVVLWIVILALPTYVRTLQMVLPVQQWATSTRFEISVPSAAFNVISSTVLAIALTAAAAWFMTRGSVRATTPTAAIWVAAFVALVVVAFIWRPDPYIVDTPVPITCQAVNEVDVCLHTANLAAFEGTATAIGKLQTAGLGSSLEKATDSAASEWTSPQPGEALLHLFPETGTDFNSERQAASSISYDMTLGNCSPDQLSLLAENQDFAMESLQRRLLELAGYPELAQNIYPSQTPEALKVTAMTTDELAVFFQTRANEIRSCELSTS